MKGKKIVLLLLCLAMILSAVYIVLAAEVGGAEDPLITASYLNDVFRPKLKAELKTELKSELGDSAGRSGDYAVEELRAGQKLIMSTSGELVLRTGAATCISPLPDAGLGDLSQGYGILSGLPVPKNNHILISRSDGRGILATEACVVVIIKGSYTIS